MWRISHRIHVRGATVRSNAMYCIYRFFFVTDNPGPDIRFAGKHETARSAACVGSDVGNIPAKLSYYGMIFCRLKQWFRSRSSMHLELNLPMLRVVESCFNLDFQFGEFYFLMRKMFLQGLYSKISWSLISLSFSCIIPVTISPTLYE